ncbi:indolepyruvate ferredoxin oxidoreductase [Candidatus Bipolaricaulota bacterium]|nr:indolepyruvate ferredoxin oxidoreductase [Candidatus Bipolaricaulota bacterium]
MTTKLLLGDEALAQGALDAGLSGAYAYPGTPSTEITEYIQRSVRAENLDVHCRWSTNEKVALEEAIGMSYAGKRAMVSMKHVGLNVAADPFINAAIAGANGGLLVSVADDPSMHSSQNEQDSRLYTDLALVPCLEPSNQQEAYDAPAYAFDLSEQMNIPVLIRLTTRLAHSRSVVKLGQTRGKNKLAPPRDRNQYILLPTNARGSYLDLIARQPQLLAESEHSPFNRYEDGPDKTRGIIASGIGYNYVQEVYNGACTHPLLKISQYPIPVKQVQRLFAECEEVILFEEGYPYIEAKIRGLLGDRDATIRGRLDGTITRTGELNPDIVARALALPQSDGLTNPSILVPRPPALCPGCPHADTYRALNAAMDRFPQGRVFSDIGCYTLGALPPHEAIDTCIEMGASITMAKGASDAGLAPAVAVIGDSTFTHSGMTGLLDCVAEDAHVTIIILDNLTVAMTGGQESNATNRLAAICSGLGVSKEHIKTIIPLPKHHDENVRIIGEEIAYEGTSVIIAVRECVQTLRRHARKGGAK